MATTVLAKTAGRSTHNTLTAADSADNVLLDRVYPFVEVKNRDGAADLYFRVDGTDAVVLGSGTIHVGPGEAVVYPYSDDQHYRSPVSIISASQVAYSVTGVNG